MSQNEATVFPLIYLFLLCIRSRFFCLEHTIRAEKSTKAIMEGMAQKVILKGKVIFSKHPSIKIPPELGE